MDYQTQWNALQMAINHNQQIINYLLIAGQLLQCAGITILSLKLKKRLT